MPAATSNFTIEQGATYFRPMQYTIEVLGVNGLSQTPPVYVVQDITNCKIRMKGKGTVGGTTYFVWTSEAPSPVITITDPANGKFEIRVPAAATAALSFTTGVYDLEIEFPDGFVRRLLKGTVTLDPEVTDG